MQPSRNANLAFGVRDECASEEPPTNRHTFLQYPESSFVRLVAGRIRSIASNGKYQSITAMGTGCGREANCVTKGPEAPGAAAS
jgi:hypothetical protein